MCSDIAAETQCNLIAIVKPSAPVGDTFKMFFKGEVYRDMNMDILKQLTQDYMPSVFGMLTMWSSWYNAFSFKGNPEMSQSLQAEDAKRVASGEIIAPHSEAETSGAFMQGGLILLDGKGKIAWSYRCSTLGDYSTHNRIRSQIVSFKEKLGY